MQISKSNNSILSFGINSVKFSPEVAKCLFKQKARNIKEEKLTKVFEKVKNIKPKKGPDIDVFTCGFGDCIRSATGEGSVIGIDKVIFSGFKITPKSLIKGFKDLVKSVDKERLVHADISSISDNILTKLGHK